MGTMSRETLVERVADSGAMPLHIVTACHGHRRDGCLVAFATQASMKPARMLVCLSTANLTYRIAVSSPALAVHLVPADRHDLAVLFGGRTGDDADKLVHTGMEKMYAPVGPPPGALSRDPAAMLGQMENQRFTLTPEDRAAHRRAVETLKQKGANSTSP
jgi:hypothetical protein